ncbi:MAG: M18 family aminopeptidase [Clostridia bacterium]|nr:M18 family aminopeptidase [Clostridia bacterium]
MEKIFLDQTKKLIEFIEESPTAFHAVKTVCERLQNQGLIPLNESEEWSLEAGKGYFVTRNQSSIIAFRVPTGKITSAMIAASHTDSPMFKLKENSTGVAFGEYVRLNTECYGGTILSSWMDRPLSLAGRVILCKDGEFLAKTVKIDRDLLLIPNVAIHQNRGVNSGYSFNPAVDMLPLFAQDDGKKASVKKLLAQELSCSEDEIAGADLYVYNRTKPCIFGADNEFFSAPRIDNLMCAYATLDGFCKADNQGALTIYYAADNEETGSATKQGAGSVFLSDVLDRVCKSLSLDKCRLLASSMMVSADNGHAKHPNHPELSDAQNSPRLNGGVVIKSNAAQKYTTDGISASIFTEICRRAGVPVQYFSNRSDMAGGSTLGSISNTLVPLITVDIGMAQLAMHSAYESAGSADTEYLCRAMKAFYESSVKALGDGSYQLTSKEADHV